MPVCCTRNRIKATETTITDSTVPASPVICSRAKVAHGHKLAIKFQCGSQLRQVDAGFLPRCLGFNPRDFVVKKVTVESGFSLIFLRVPLIIIISTLPPYLSITESHRRMDNGSTFYLGCSWFKSRHGERLP
jgi:hypothetical protein